MLLVQIGGDAVLDALYDNSDRSRVVLDSSKNARDEKAIENVEEGD